MNKQPALCVFVGCSLVISSRNKMLWFSSAVHEYGWPGQSYWQRVCVLVFTVEPRKAPPSFFWWYMMWTIFSHAYLLFVCLLLCLLRSQYIFNQLFVFSYCWVLRVFYQLSFANIFSIFSLNLCLRSHSPDNAFSRAEIFNFNNVSLSIISFMDHVFHVIF